MATVNPIYTVINSISNQIVGKAVVTDTDVRGLTSFGKEVLSTQDNVETFFNVVSDVLYKTILSNRPYRINNDIARNEIEWGAAIRKIRINPLIGTEDDSDTWAPTDGQTYSPFVIKKVQVEQSIFSKFGQFKIHVTVPGRMLKTAFNSVEEFGAFIDYISGVVEDQLNVIEDALANLARSSGIASAYEAGTAALNPTNQVHDLLAEYNELTGLSKTVDDVQTDSDFWKYVAMVIELDKKYLAKMRTDFNSAGFPRHTPEADLKVNIIAEDAAKIKYFMTSDTFNKELVELEGYTEIPYWQAPSDIHKVSVVINDDVDDQTPADPTTVEGVIACMYDREAIGTNILLEQTGAINNPRTLTTEQWYHFAKGLYVDPSENFIVYLLKDAEGNDEGGDGGDGGNGET